MYGNSRDIRSAQDGVHPSLERLLARHLSSPFTRPVSPATRAAYTTAMAAWDGKQPLLLDAGCGVGWSTLALAREYAGHFVIGVDQSSDRIERGKPGEMPANAVFACADLVDFWRLLLADGLRLDRHFLLYPNPWPKIGHLSRRWHGHAVFPDILALGGTLELRTNWQIYADEFAWAVARVSGRVAPVMAYETDAPLTPFERKYRDSGQTLWRYAVGLNPQVQGG